MSFIGQIISFDHGTGEWSIFSQRLTQFFVINKVSEDSAKKAVLLTHLSDETFRLLRNLVYPKEITSLSFDKLIQALDKHFTPKRASFADKAKFYEATRNPGESLAEFAARLRGLASYCDFGAALETLLRDRFILGLGIGPERDRLFEQDAASVSLDKALEIAQQAESARLAKSLMMKGPTAIKEEPSYRASSSGGGGGASRSRHHVSGP